jgi:hypothetical protein
MAQTRKRRRRKRRGTQGGRVDRRPRGRPRNRQEASARARSRTRGPASRFDTPPTWRSAINRGLVAAAIFTVLVIVAFGRSAPQAIAFGALMLAFYIPMGYFIDNMIWRRRLRSRDKAREAD